MTKKKRDYWTKRQKELNKQQDKDEEALSKRLNRYYEAESRRLTEEIAAYYAEYGADNVIEYRTLLESLSDEDKDLLYQRMDDFAKKYPEYAHLMPIRESIYKLNRLEGLKTSIQMQMMENAAYLNKEVEKLLEKTGLRNYMAAKNLLGDAFNFEDENIINTFVGKNWANGKNYSDRIWDNSKKLTEYINKDLTQGFARGTNYETLARNLRERYKNVSRKDAMRLVYTEGTYVMNEARAQVFEKDFKEYEIIPIEDKHTCQICMDMIGKHFRYEDREPGTNYPPFHPWCRCLAAPYTPEWDEEVFDTNGKYNMDYRHELDEKDILNYDDSVIAKKVIGSPNNIYISDKLSIKPKKIQKIEKMVSEYKKMLGTKGKDEPKIVLIHDTELGLSGGRYDAESNTIFYKIYGNEISQRTAILHELYHWEDAQRYIAAGNKITSNKELIDYECRKCKEKLDKLGINADNVGNISEYAKNRLKKERYDEVYTEYRTMKVIRRR